MPYISRMVSIDGKPYLDGGCSCKIPLHWALENNFPAIIVIKTRPEGHRRDPNAGRNLARLVYGPKWPALTESLARSNADYNRLCDEIDDLKEKKRIFVISPSRFMDIKRMEGNLEKLGEWYWLGYHDAQALIPELKKYLADSSSSVQQNDHM